VWTCIYVLEVSIFRSRFDDFPIGFRNCSDGLVFLFFIFVWWFCIITINAGKCSNIHQSEKCDVVQSEQALHTQLHQNLKNALIIKKSCDMPIISSVIKLLKVFLSFKKIKVNFLYICVRGIDFSFSFRRFSDWISELLWWSGIFVFHFCVMILYY
jgi:hypothetical protein